MSLHFQKGDWVVFSYETLHKVMPRCFSQRLRVWAWRSDPWKGFAPNHLEKQEGYTIGDQLCSSYLKISFCPAIWFHVRGLCLVRRLLCHESDSRTEPGRVKPNSTAVARRQDHSVVVFVFPVPGSHVALHGEAEAAPSQPGWLIFVFVCEKFNYTLKWTASACG